jgi:hypothetical protein
MAEVRVFRQAERSAARVIDGAAYVVSVDLQMMLELNEVGTLVWESLSVPASVDDLALVVSEAFQVERDDAVRDVVAFLRTLVERGVAVEESAAT